MEGAFNRVAVKLAPGARERAVIDASTRTLGALRRARRASAATTRPRTRCSTTRSRSSTCWAACCRRSFSAVAAFLLNVVMSRLVSTQREQIAALKALGYPNRTIALHYLKLVLVIVARGPRARRGARRLAGHDAHGAVRRVLPLPGASNTASRRGCWSTSPASRVATAVLGTLNAIAATVRLAPAEAMRPPAPGALPPHAARAPRHQRMGPALRMIAAQHGAPAAAHRRWRSAASRRRSRSS